MGGFCAEVDVLNFGLSKEMVPKFGCVGCVGAKQVPRWGEQKIHSLKLTAGSSQKAAVSGTKSCKGVLGASMLVWQIRCTLGFSVERLE